jgi:hypothetical protein
LGNNVLALTFPGGNFVTDIDSITLANNTLLNHDIIVPVGKRWVLLSIKAMNPDNVNRDISFNIYNEAAATNLAKHLDTRTIATTAQMYWPNNGTGGEDRSNIPHLVIMSGGQLLRIIFAAGGASAGGTDADGVVITYLEL